MAMFTRKQITVEAVQLLYPTTITTPKGVLKGQKGDYLVATNGDQFMVAKDVFEMTYEVAGNPDTLAPLEVGSLAVNTITHNTATLSFLFPADADLAKIKIYQDGLLINEAFKNTGVFTYIVNGLTPETPYTFKVTTVDAVGNESTGVEIVATTEVDPNPAPVEEAPVTPAE